MCEVDEVAVQRAMDGDRVPLTTPERVLAVARMTARGLSQREIARRLHRAQRTVARYRRFIRLVREAA